MPQERAVTAHAEDRDPLLSTSSEQLIRLRMALEASGEIIFMTDAEGVITYVNPEFVRVYGYKPEELVGRTTPRILQSGTTPAEEYAAFWQQLKSRNVVRREFVNRTKSGLTVLIESSANPIVVDGELVGFLGVQRDITSRRATEAALRESEARYRTLAEAAHDSIFIISPDARIEYANAVCCARFRVDPQDVIGRRVHDVFPAQVAEQLWREVSSVLASGERSYFEDRFESPAGDLWLGAWLAPMSRGSDGTNAVMGVARDVTERKRLEREFAQAQKMEAVGQLAGGVAHDFNNLLTAILGYSEMLAESVGHDPQLAADVYEIRKAGERASRLTRQLLTFSRKETFSPVVLNLNDVVAELQKMLQRIIGEDVLLDIAADAQFPTIKADPSALEQIIVNLVVNARDAMPRGGTVRITTTNARLDADFVREHAGAVAGNYVALSVQDTGCGMTPEVLTHLFEPFFTTKPPGKGTGLGLSTVYGIVKQSGGYITIDSTPGVGSVFTTYFPMNGDSPARVLPESTARRTSGNETILLVEDEAGLRGLMRRSLEHYGYTVLATETVAEALAAAEHHDGRIDLLLSDVVMPVLSGPELAERVVAARPDIKVLYVSGYTNHAALQRTIGTRTQFLAKPFASRALAAKVRECLDA
jgi:PAS domain S-box-containing protein